MTVSEPAINLLLGLTVFIESTLAVFLFKRTSSKSYITYFNYSVALAALWTLLVLLIRVSPDKLLLSRLAFIPPSLIPWLLLVFVLNYPRPLQNFSKWTVFLLGLPAYIFSFLSMSPFILHSTNPDSAINAYGPLHFAFGLYLITSFLFILGTLIKNSIVLQGALQQRIRYVLFGISFPLIVSLVFNIILPMIGDSSLNFVGPISGILMVLIITYSLFRHQLFGVEILVKRSINYLLLIATTSTIVSVFLFFVGDRLIHLFSIPKPVNYVIVSIIVTAVYPLFRQTIDHLTENTFFRKSYNLSQMLNRLGDKLNRLLDKEVIFNETISEISATIPIDSTSLFTINEDTFCLVSSTGLIPSQSTISNQSELIRYFKDYHGPIILDHLHFDILHLNTNELFSYDKICMEMASFHAKVCFPLLFDNHVIGLLFLGEKSAKLPYTTYDISILSSVSKHVGISIQNATRHEQIQQYLTKLTSLNLSAKTINASFDKRFIAIKAAELYSSLFAFDYTIFLGLHMQTLYPLHIHNSLLTSLYQYRLSLTNSPLKNKMRDHLVISLSDMLADESDPNHAFWAALQTLNPRGHYSFIPIKKGDALMGAIIGVSSHPPAKAGHLLSGELLPIACEKIAAALYSVSVFNRTQKLQKFNSEILANLSVGVAVIDSNAIIIQMNPACEKLLNVRKQSAIGKPLDSFYSVCQDLSLIETTLLTGRSQSIESRIATPKRVTPIALTIQPMNNLDNGHIGAIAMISDLSSIQSLQLQVEQSNRLSTLGTMAASISHEIRNPLVAIKAFSQLLPKNWDDPSFRDKYTTIVGPQVERISELAQALTQLGKPLDSSFEIVNLHRVFQDLIVLLEGERKHHEATIELSIPETISLYADANQLGQIFLNLLMNSMQAMTQGGHIKIVSLLLDSNYVQIMVSDTGPGMAKATIKDLFKPFFSTKESGTGLGLSVVKTIIDRHQGHIEVSSKVGVGTTFTLYLPGPNANQLQFESDTGIIIKKDMPSEINSSFSASLSSQFILNQ